MFLEMKSIEAPELLNDDWDCHLAFSGGFDSLLEQLNLKP
jgi:hypothetical protein